MSLRYGFYNSVNRDRLYDAKDMSKIFDGIIYDGVYAGTGNCFSVIANNNMTVTVKSGRAWFNNTWTYNDSDMVLTVPASELSQNRIDAVIIEVNTNEDVRANTIKIISGTPSSSPVAPTYIRELGVFQYPLALISVTAGATSIGSAAITNKVGSEDCPFATGIMQSSSIDSLWTNWNNEFRAWFNNLYYVLDGDVAGHLEHEIAGKANNEAWVTVTMAASGWSNATYSFESLYPSSSYDILDVLPSEQCTAAQRTAYLNADMAGYYATNIVKAHAYVPSIDIPVAIRVRYNTPGGYVPGVNG